MKFSSPYGELNFKHVKGSDDWRKEQENRFSSPYGEIFPKLRARRNLYRANVVLVPLRGNKTEITSPQLR